VDIPHSLPLRTLVTAGLPGYSGTMADIFDVIADGTRRELLTHLLRHSGSRTKPGEVAVSELVTERVPASYQLFGGLKCGTS